MDNIIMKTEPYCWSGNKLLSHFGHTFTIVSIIPYSVPFINNIIVSKKSTFCGFYLMVYMKVVTALAHILQDAIMWERPHPECTPSIISPGGFPDPGIVYLWASVLTSIFLSVVRKKRDYEREKKELDDLECHNSILNIMLFRMLNKKKSIVLLCGQIALYLVVYNFAYLASLTQILLSVVFASFFMIPMFWLIIINMPIEYL